ncbi:hypothetical protein [Aporhodopirellula aestuarii]|uniref:Uncharacterized protein n=1 Tax=Aporhodopirellula aestuarii TaxID=2950107 RepID=A0ABT0U7D8_9BACT|nr:hypothetical protein [Aporhodopirellula aestuarii]MCM2372266.1 hypothetical protein [Aporhodopirellula aestuarii]
MKTLLQKRAHLRSLIACAAIAFGPVAAMQQASAQTGDYDREEQGDKVEDDAWYDISEWFDGNDYNPTDEAIGRWDDEVWSYHDARTSTDEDNDDLIVDAETFYGDDYNESYESYEDRNQDGNYERSSRYVDSDGDYLNDAYVTYEDTDNDGMYDTYDYKQLSSTTQSAVHPSSVAQSVQEGLSGKRHTISGTVEDHKMVKRLDNVALMLHVQSDDGEKIWVDLGSNGIDTQLFKGDRAEFHGPIVKRGDKEVLLATEVIIANAGSKKITRTGHQYNGVVESTKTAKVRGKEHHVVKLKTDDGKKLTVDMGDASANEAPQKGDEIAVTGVAVKVGDRVVVVADQNRS